jgi:hypothetical protein
VASRQSRPVHSRAVFVSQRSDARIAALVVVYQIVAGQPFLKLAAIG